jgi:hypothetical protein
MVGNNLYLSNFRIATDGNDHGYELFLIGIKPVMNVV